MFAKIVTICDSCGGTTTYGNLHKTKEAAEAEKVDNEGMTCSRVKILDFAAENKELKGDYY